MRRVLLRRVAIALTFGGSQGSKSMFATLSTAELERRLHFHENDRGTTTMDQECARMYLIQEIRAELKRRA
jgi:hypothetical protein